MLPGRRVLWFDFAAYRWETHRLDGSLLRAFEGVGETADPHDLQIQDDGSYLLGARVKQSHVDTSAYGGSSDASVVNVELQEVTPAGQLAWDWRSREHVSLGATGRCWPWAIDRGPGGYDILHWNSIDRDGGRVIASFRHLDAVYSIRKGSGQIAWKLGGTKTPKRLTVRNDPLRYTLGAQHDARMLADGTLTVFDNRTELGHPEPRAVRFRIDEQKRTATLVQSITDPNVTQSSCCGSARRLGNGHWLIGWGMPNGIGGYRADGRRTFYLRFSSTFSYRAEPVPPGALSAADLRQAMDDIYAQPG